MKAFFSTALLIPILSTGALANDGDDAKLRDLVRLPKVFLKGGYIFFNSTEGIVLPMNKREVDDEILAIQKSLKGDASDASRYSPLACLYGTVRDDKRSKQANDKALELYCRLIEKQPKNARLRADLAMLMPDSEEDKAERILRMRLNWTHSIGTS